MAKSEIYYLHYPKYISVPGGQGHGLGERILGAPGARSLREAVKLAVELSVEAEDPYLYFWYLKIARTIDGKWWDVMPLKEDAWGILQSRWTVDMGRSAPSEEDYEEAGQNGRPGIHPSPSQAWNAAHLGVPVRLDSWTGWDLPNMDFPLSESKSKKKWEAALMKQDAEEIFGLQFLSFNNLPLSCPLPAAWLKTSDGKAEKKLSENRGLEVTGSSPLPTNSMTPTSPLAIGWVEIPACEEEKQ